MSTHSPTMERSTPRGAAEQPPQANGSPSAKDAAAAAKKKGLSSEKLKALWPDIWAMVRPRRWLLLVGLVLMAINRVAGLVLPWAIRPVIDEVVTKHQQQKLVPLITAVVVATVIQGISSYS